MVYGDQTCWLVTFAAAVMSATVPLAKATFRVMLASGELPEASQSSRLVLDRETRAIPPVTFVEPILKINLVGSAFLNMHTQTRLEMKICFVVVGRLQCSRVQKNVVGDAATKSN